MNVKQTIQRVWNGLGDQYVVGSTRNASVVTEVEFLFHEIGPVNNLLNFFTTNDLINHTECHLKHALSSTRRNTFNRNVVKLLDFFLEQQNPYSVTVNVVVPLRNLLTKLAVDKGVAMRLLVCFGYCGRVYRS